MRTCRLLCVASPVLPSATMLTWQTVAAQEAFVAEDDTTCTDDAMLGLRRLRLNGQRRVQRTRDTAHRRGPFRRAACIAESDAVSPDRAACLWTRVRGMPARTSISRLAPAFNSHGRIIAELERLRPDGNTPLTQAVRDAAEALQFREKPAVVVLVTDGEETCGGTPCRLAASLLGEAAAVTVHVIGFKVRGRFFQWQSQSGGASRGQTASRCLADMTGGKYVSTETTEELVAALQKTLGCPVLSESNPVK